MITTSSMYMEPTQLLLGVMGILGNVGVLLRRLGTGEIGVPSDDLQLAIGHLVQHHTDTGSGVQRITYTYLRKPDGKWKFEADFTYPED